MLSEEKKAIEYFKNKLKEFEKRLGTKITTEDNINIETILNLIEKQQEELNKEKEKNKELEDTLKQTQDSWYKDTKIIEEFKQNYISKDKIKAKLEELETIRIV